MISKKREATERYYFERWAKRYHYDLSKFKDGSYQDAVTDEMWGAWLARARMDYCI